MSWAKSPSKSPAKPFEAVRQDRVWAEPSSKGVLVELGSA